MNSNIHQLKILLTLFLAIIGIGFCFAQKTEQQGMVSAPFNYFNFSKTTHAEKDLPYNSPCTDCIEDISARTETTRTFNGKNGLVYSQAGYSAINIKNSAGNWVPVDARLKLEGNGIYAARDQHFPTEIDMSKGSAIKNMYGEIRFNNKPELLYKTEDGNIQSLGKADFSHYSAGDDGIKITDVWPGIDMEMRMLLGGIKTNFVLKQKPQQTEGYFLIRDEFILSSGLGILLDGNEGIIKTTSGEEAFHISACIGYDSKSYREYGVQRFDYALQGNTLDMVIPLATLHASRMVYPYTIDPLVNSSNTIPQAPMNGSGYGAACFSNYCNYTMNVPTPANTDVIDVLWSFNYVATGGCLRDDGALTFTSGSCASPPQAGLYWFCNLATAGTCIGNNVSLYPHISACMPAPSCTPQNVPFSMRFYRCFDNTGGCSNTCIGAASPWTMTIVGRTVEVASATVDNTNTVTVCRGTSVALNALGAFGIGPYSYSWNPGNITGASTNVSPNTTQTYTLTVTDACLQTSTANVTVNVTSIPTTPVITSNSPLCVGQTLSLNTTSPGNYFWTGPNGFTSNIQSPSITSVNAARAGTYNLFVVQSGCTSLVATHSVVINNIPATPTANGNSPICAGNPINLTATGGSSYLWTGPNSFSSNTQNPGINPSAANHAGTYGVVTIASGCTSAVANVTVIINPIPSTPTINSNAPLCENATLNLTTTSAGNYFWSGPDGFASNLQNPNINGMVPAQSGTYSLFIVQNGCTSVTSTSSIIIHSRPAINPIPNQSVCQGATTTVVVPSGSPGAAYSWTNSNSAIGLATSGNGNIPAFNAINSGMASITVTPTANGCAGTPTTFTITVNSAPTANPINNKTFCTGITTAVTLVSGPIPGTTFSWTSSHADIGLAMNGSGDIPGFITTNTGNTSISSTIEITPSSNGCPGVPAFFTITVIPNPTVASVPDQLFCNGASTSSTTFTGAVIGTSFSWNNSNTSVGLAGSGNGNIPTFNAANPSGIPITSTVTITPSVGACSGTDVNFTITVNPTFIGTPINAAICDGETYIFGNQNYNTPGNHPTTFQSVHGCDSVVTLALSVNPSYVNTENATICDGETYTFGGQPFTIAGNYPNTFQSIYGCDSVVTLALSVNPAFAETEIITICSGDTYTFGGQPFTTTGNFPMTFQSIGGCDSLVTLALTVNPVFTGVETVTICDGEFYTFGPQSFSTSGNYPITFQTINGCDSLVTLTLTVNPTYTSAENASICFGDSYTFGGQTFNAAGNYLVTFQSATGCDSTVTLNLSINPVYTETENAVICDGGFYTFDGQQFLIAGNYPHTFQSIHGCDSMVTLMLTVNPVYDGTEQVAICDGDFHTFGGQQFTTAGNYPMTFQSVNGCDSVVTLLLSVKPTYTETVNITICDGDSYAFGGQSFTTAGNFLVAFLSVHGCDSVVTLNLNINPAFTGTESATICDGESYTIDGQSFTTAGNFPIVFQSISGCDSIVTLLLSINPTYTRTENITICDGESYTVGGQQFTTTGHFQIAFQSINGCDSVLTLHLTVNPSYASTLQQTICEGTSVLFNGISYNTTGSYSETFQTVNNCDSTVTLELTVTPVSVANIQPQADQCLEGNSFDFSLSENYGPSAIFSWTFTGANTTISNLQTPTNINYPNPGPYTVGVNITENGCQSQGILQVNVLAQPDAQFNALPPAGCSPLIVEFTNITSGGGNITWAFSGGNPSTSNASPVTVLYNAPGQYTVALTVTSANGCTDTETVQDLIHVQNPPSAGFTIQPVEINITNPTATFIDGSTGSSNIFYYVGDDGSITPGPDASYLFSQEGDYKVMQVVTSSAGCADTAYGNLTVVGNTEVFIPSAFTPNLDPINPGFRILGTGFSDFRMTIFDRWGEILFVSIDENHTWDGTYQGKLMPSGVYVYKIEVRDSKKSQRIYTGHLNLIR